MKGNFTKTFIFITLAFFSKASSGEVFYLRPDQSISELLKVELKIKDIYGPEKKLRTVLRVNRLTFQKARHLPIGHPVMIPHELLPPGNETPTLTILPEGPKPLEEMKPERERPAYQVTYTHSLSVSLGGFYYEGKGEAENFFGSGVLLGGESKNDVHYESFDLGLSLLGAMTNVKTPHWNQLVPLFEIRPEIIAKNVLLKPRVFGGIRRNFYLYFPQGKDEKLDYAVIPYGGFGVEKSFELMTLSFSSGLSLGAQTSQNETVKTAPFFELGLQKQDYFLKTRLEKRKIMEEEQTYLEFSLGMGL